jgi:exopolysaccharide biosynthesis predicted pyruvyltransferase EpsI
MLPPLIDINNFNSVFSELKGKKIGFVVTLGNVGDWLIEDSAVQLFNKFGINFKYVNSRLAPNKYNEEVCRWADEFVFNGGGSMGDLYTIGPNIRKEILDRYKKPMTILPQTFNSREDLNYKKVWVRDNESLKYRGDAEIAPDLALGYEFKSKIPKAIEDIGVWLREDVEMKDFIGISSLGDPVKICKTPEEYILLASKYKKIVTNRLHFAIAGLIARREVVLLPNKYFKNYSVWDTWLKYLGCEWNYFWSNKI